MLQANTSLGLIKLLIRCIVRQNVYYIQGKGQGQYLHYDSSVAKIDELFSAIVNGTSRRSKRRGTLKSITVSTSHNMGHYELLDVTFSHIKTPFGPFWSPLIPVYCSNSQSLQHSKLNHDSERGHASELGI